MKHLVIRVSGSRGKPVKIKIRPGTTSRDILTYLKLAGFVLAPFADPTQEFAPEADVYRETREGERLVAMTRLEATDRFIEQVAGESRKS